MPSSFRVSIQPAGFVKTPDIEIGEGIAVLAGRNNVGKSRLLRAIHILAAEPRKPIAMDADISITDEGGWSGRLEARPHSADVSRWTVTDPSGHVTRDQVYHRTGTRQFQLQDLLRSRTVTHGLGADAPSILEAAPSAPPDLTGQLNRVAFVDPQRVIPDAVPTNPATVPDSNGANLGMVLYTHRNNADGQFSALEAAISRLFPEVGGILTRPVGNGRTQVHVRDRLARTDIPLAECGTGIAQFLHFLALVLFSPADRIFLIDEPHVYLHADAERALAQFLRDHLEHSYAIATHSPILIDALAPDRIWHLVRTDAGSHVHPIVPEGNERQQVFHELGWRPSQLAWADRILFVEGETEEKVFPIWFDRWGWASARTRCPIIELTGADQARDVRQWAGRLERMLALPFVILRDGDKQTPDAEDAHLGYLPVDELEGLFLRDLETVRAVLLEERCRVTEENLQALVQDWPLDRIRAVLGEYAHRKPSHQLTRIANAMKTRYKKTVHGPLIAARMDLGVLADVRELLHSYVLGEEENPSL